MDAHDTLEEAASASDGSALIHPDDIARLIAQVEGQHSKRLRVTTGCRSVDEALEGGQECGIQGLCCVSGDKETGKTWLALAFLASHLLESPRSNAAIIDTIGNFDVLRLHATIASRLQPDAVPQHQRSDGHKPCPRPEDAATKVLERVKIMRVFDFVGVKEAIEELKEEISKKVQRPESRTPVGVTPCTSGQTHGRGVEVADSEDDFSSDEGEEEMLFVSMKVPETKRPHSVGVEGGQRSREIAGERGGATWMLVIDSITQVLSPLMRIKYVEDVTSMLTSIRLTAHEMLASLMRDLAQLARSHNLLSLVVNSGIMRQPPTLAPGSRPDGPDATSFLQNYFSSSAFEACTTYPALGKTFPFLVDMHMLVSRLPKGKRDASAYYESTEQTGNVHASKSREVEMVHMVEVLSDGWDDRAGRLAAFQCIPFAI